MNEEKQLVTAYVVRSAETMGIQTVVARIHQPSPSTGRYLRWEVEGNSRYCFYEGKQWTLDRAEAVKLATAKVEKAIKSTEAKLAKLRKLRFE